MRVRRYRIRVTFTRGRARTVTVRATSRQEARMIVERELAGVRNWRTIA